MDRLDVGEHEPFRGRFVFLQIRLGRTDGRRFLGKPQYRNERLGPPARSAFEPKEKE